MRALFRLVAAGLLVLGLSGAAAAQDGKPTMDDAKAITLKAADLLAAQGLDDAAKAFNADGEFKRGEIYVNVIDLDGVWRVYPPKPAGVGQNMSQVKDADGVFIIQEILKVAKDKGEGWVEYRWKNPASEKIEPKVTYVKKVAGKDLVAYVGIYK
ncbi:cache domain-containing protein [Azospirillum sp. TSO22-1]|uniref:cache domain-containing protein n=1 Tax=Azospirillum sp. TSO22-1 TaxID=716789 RepID=UPI000D6198C9|nr:cache domain-containing protein [Azospirillum sp. TSO22-1]PWC54514.1 chemotaxis protein [Azospirillum sp. TSO22-1]